MRDEVLFVNGVAAEYGNRTQVKERTESGGTTTGLRTTERIAGKEHAVQFLPQLNAARSFGPYVVPQDSYFFLGDNRDASNDSRHIGPGPRKLLIGHANHIVVSADIPDRYSIKYLIKL